jgi:chitinase
VSQAGITLLSFHHTAAQNDLQLYLLKLANRNFKVILSVGGGTSSTSGHFSFITDSKKRNTFVNSAVQFIEDYGLDGIDVDYEYPTAADKQDFADLLTSLRAAFDQLSAKKDESEPYQLSVCTF